MSVTFEDFLKSAEILLNNPNSTEMDFRNLISRSYYSVFHLAKEKSDSLFNKPENKEPDNELKSHEIILVNFSRHHNKAIKQLGKIMFRLRDTRHKADYDINETILRNEAAEHFNRAKGIIEKLQNLK